MIASAKDTDDAKAAKICRDIAKAFEEQLTYPGEIKVTVVRESRFHGSGVGPTEFSSATCDSCESCSSATSSASRASGSSRGALPGCAQREALDLVDRQCRERGRRLGAHRRASIAS